MTAAPRPGPEPDPRQECWQGAVYAFGTSKIFEWRAGRLQRKLASLSYIGIAAPLLVGSLALSFGVTSIALGVIVPVVSVIGVVQLLIAAWSIVGKWSENLSYSRESALVNATLATRFESLAKQATLDATRREQEMRILQVEDNGRRQQDLTHAISERERRKGMRAALRQYRRSCSICGVIPTNMTPTQCDNCGKF